MARYILIQMKNKPRIAVTQNINSDGTVSILPQYTLTLENAGADVVLLPYTDKPSEIIEMVKSVDGICFTGGADVDPKRYFEEKMSCCGETEDKRDLFELAVFFVATEENKPILGICRGMQLINVAMGGTLYQDILTEYVSDIAHIQKEGKFEHSHEVNVINGSPLYNLLGNERIKINSFHHQAIKKLAEGLDVMARADDGIIEAVYASEYKYLRAYQWHPERIYQIDKNQALIFEDFINACKE